LDLAVTRVTFPQNSLARKVFGPAVAESPRVHVLSTSSFWTCRQASFLWSLSTVPDNEFFLEDLGVTDLGSDHPVMQGNYVILPSFSCLLQFSPPFYRPCRPPQIIPHNTPCTPPSRDPIQPPTPCGLPPLSPFWPDGFSSHSFSWFPASPFPPPYPGLASKENLYRLTVALLFFLLPEPLFSRPRGDKTELTTPLHKKQKKISFCGTQTLPSSPLPCWVLPFSSTTVWKHAPPIAVSVAWGVVF